MGLLPKPNSTTTTSHDKNGMGLLVVFFPKQKTTTTIANNTDVFSSSPPSSFKRTNSNPLLSKTQSTISICVFLLFTTLLFFILSPPSNTITLSHTTPHIGGGGPHFPSTALQRMGTLYRRGTKAMNDIVVCHVVEDTAENDFRLFLRVLHRSGITSKSDVVFIFASSSTSSRFNSIIRDENDSFLSLLELHSHEWSEVKTRLNLANGSSFDFAQFFKAVKIQKKVESGEPVWGKRMRSNSSGEEDGEESELTRPSYGSVLSFDANELDLENSLSGFIDRVPLSLRRWACYTMLLGRVRRNFKHVMLVDVKNILIVNDPLGRVRNRSPNSVFLLGKHGKSTQSQNLVNSGIIMGGARGVRRLSSAMLVEIVRVAMQHKKRNSVSESVVLSRLVQSEFFLKNVDLITSSESELILETSALGAINSAGSRSFSDYQIIQRGTGNRDLNHVIKKQLCSSAVDSSIYRDC